MVTGVVKGEAEVEESVIDGVAEEGKVVVVLFVLERALVSVVLVVVAMVAGAVVLVLVVVMVSVAAVLVLVVANDDEVVEGFSILMEAL